MTPPCGVPPSRSMRLPSAVCIGAFSHLSMYSSAHGQSVCLRTSRRRWTGSAALRCRCRRISLSASLQSMRRWPSRAGWRSSTPTDAVSSPGWLSLAYCRRTHSGSEWTAWQRHAALLADIWPSAIRKQPHSRLDGMTPDQAYLSSLFVWPPSDESGLIGLIRPRSSRSAGQLPSGSGPHQPPTRSG